MRGVKTNVFQNESLSIVLDTFFAGSLEQAVASHLADDHSGISEDDLTLAVLEAGAEDVETEDEGFVVITPVDTFHSVQAEIEKLGASIKEADLAMNPTNKVAIAGDDVQRLMRLLDRLDELDDVQMTYFNADLPEDLE